MKKRKCAIDLKICFWVCRYCSCKVCHWSQNTRSHWKPSFVTARDTNRTLLCRLFSPSHLRRIMRFLVHQGLFKEVPTKDGLATGYTNTPLSRRMMITKRESRKLLCFSWKQVPRCLLHGWSWAQSFLRRSMFQLHRRLMQCMVRTCGRSHRIICATASWSTRPWLVMQGAWCHV